MCKRLRTKLPINEELLSPKIPENAQEQMLVQKINQKVVYNKKIKN